MIVEYCGGDGGGGGGCGDGRRTATANGVLRTSSSSCWRYAAHCSRRAAAAVQNADSAAGDLAAAAVTAIAPDPYRTI